MKPIHGLIIFVIIAGAIAAFAVLGSDTEDADTDSVEQTTTTQSESNTTAETSDTMDSQSNGQDTDTTTTADITVATVAMHNQESDCWSIINGKVYDLTSYIPRHPGGAAILSACGTDGTSLFTERTTEEGEPVGSGTPHSGNATAQLQSLYVGDLAE